MTTHSLNQSNITLIYEPIDPSAPIPAFLIHIIVRVLAQLAAEVSDPELPTIS